METNIVEQKAPTRTLPGANHWGSAPPGEPDLRDFTENAPVGLHCLGPDGVILWANQTELDMLGYTREEYIGCPVADFHVDRPVIEAILACLRKGETLNDYEARLRCKDGSTRHVLISSNVLFEGGEFIHIRCSARDITGRKRAADLLATQHAITQVLAEAHSLSDAVPRLIRAVCQTAGWDLGALWQVDETAGILRCVEVSKRSQEQFFHFEADTRSRTFLPGVGLPGRVWSSGAPAWVADVTHDPNFARASAAVQEGLHGAFAFPVSAGARVLGVIEFFSSEVRKPERELLDLLAGFGGQIGQFAERKRAEQTLRESEERYRRLVGLMPAAVYTCAAPSGVITFYNDHAAMLWGRSPRLGDTEDRFCGSFKLWRPNGQNLPHHETPMAAALQAGRAFRNEDVIIERPDGSRIAVLVNIDPICDERGKVIGAVNVFCDTTALRESERQFREMIDALPAAVYTTDPEGRLTHFNRAAVEFSGRQPELGTDQWCVSWKLYNADGTPLPHDKCPMAIALKEGRAVRGVEAIAERPDGKRVWFAPYPTPLRDATGAIVGGINMLVDITDRKLAEETRALLGAIVDSSQDSIISKTLDGVVTSWNKGAELMFGYAAHEMIGQPITNLIPPERLNEERQILDRVSLGQPVEHFETIRLRKDGSRLDVSLMISPVKDGSGRTIGASKIARDITRHKQAETALRQSEERFRTLVSVITDIPWVVDARGSFTARHPAWEAYTGQTWDQYRGLGWADALHPEDRQRVTRVWQQACSDRTLYQCHARLWHAPSQQWRHYVGKATPLLNADGSIREWVGAVTDVDDQKRAEEKLEQTVAERTAALQATNEQLEAFVYSIAHDLRAPLRSMTAYSQLLVDDHASALNESAQRMLKRIQGSSEFMDRLLMDLLAYGRTARADLELGPVEVEKAWEAALFQDATQIEQVLADVQTVGPLPNVRAHETTLGQVLANLLSNALKFVAAGVRPRVRFRAEECGNCFRLWVEDNGVGIPADQRERVFRVFERLHGSRYPGTGIGLSIVRKGVERMGGSVGVRIGTGPGQPILGRLAQSRLKCAPPGGDRRVL